MAGKWIKLSPEEPADVAARDVLRERLKDLAKARSHIDDSLMEREGARAVKAVHDLRVSARRAGLALKTFGGFGEPELSEQLGRWTKKLRKPAGSVRDTDIRLQLLRELALRGASAHAPAIAHLVELAEEERRGALDKLIAAAERHSEKAWRRAAESLLESLHDPGREPVSALARASLHALATEAREAGEKDLSEIENLHGLRLALKDLRYAAELFFPAIDPALQDSVYPVLEHAQQVLGDVNDVARLVEFVECAVQRAASGERESAKLSASLSHLRSRYSAVLDRRRQAALDWWRNLDRAELFRLLGANPRGVPAEAVNAMAPAASRMTPLHANGVGDAQETGEPGRRPEAIGSQRSLWLSGEKFGVIDIGSNSIRLLAVELLDGRSWRSLAEERAMTRLAHGMADSRMLSPEAMAASVEAISRFRAIAERLGVTRVRAFATAAVREAANARDFAGLVHDRAGLALEIVSERDEGKLTHRSVARAFDLSRGPAAVIDLGGGSMEVVFSDAGVITENISMPLGAVRLTEAFGGADACSGPRFEDLRRHVQRAIEESVPKRETSPDLLVGCGGTFTTILTLAAASRGVLIDRNSPAIRTLGPVSRPQLSRLIEELRALPLEQRLRVPGLPSDRADIIVAGLTAVERLMKHLGAANVHVHPGGFREGLVLRMIDDSSSPPDRGAHTASREVREFAAAARSPRAHSEHVAALALSLYDQMLAQHAPIPSLGSDRAERHLLEAAGVLHDVGCLVEYRAHHKHSRTMILHADLPSLSPREQELVATIARYHRRADPKRGHDEFASLSESDRELVRRLAAILRVADGLDRDHTQRVRAVRVSPEPKAIVLHVEAAEDPTVNIEAALSKSSLLGGLVGRDVLISTAPEMLDPSRGVSAVPRRESHRRSHPAHTGASPNGTPPG